MSNRRGAADPRGDRKLKLLDWAEAEGEGLDLRAKVILCKLAAYADADCRGWAEVKTLARAANCEARAAQYRLRELEGRGLILRTGEQHRLKDSTRSVPIYQLAPEVEGLGMPVSMGAKNAPIDGAWVQNDDGMGATGLHPHKEPKGTYERTNVLSDERARELRRIFDQVEASFPKRGLILTDRAQAWAAFLDLAGQGVDVEALPSAAALYAADPMLKRYQAALVGLQVWLSGGRYRGTMPEAVAEAAAAEAGEARTGFAGPAELRAAVVAAKGETFAGAYLDRCNFVDGVIVPRTGIALARLSEIRDVLSQHGAALSPRAFGGKP